MDWCDATGSLLPVDSVCINANHPSMMIGKTIVRMGSRIERI
jgi:hypothetical protein